MEDEKQLKNEELSSVSGGHHMTPNETYAVGDWCRAVVSTQAVADDEVYLVIGVNGRNLTVKPYTYGGYSKSVSVGSVVTKNQSFFYKCDPPYWQDKIENL